jgi:hypothetical protein
MSRDASNGHETLENFINVSLFHVSKTKDQLKVLTDFYYQ